MKESFSMRRIPMNRKRILLAALLAALIVSIVAMTSRQSATASSASCTAANYNAVNDFSTTSNPNSPWSYGWEASLGGPFTLNAAERTVYEGLDTWEGPQGCGGEFNLPIVSLNHTGTTLNYASGVSQPANMLNLHPSCSGKLSVLRWTAPSTGSFDVAGLFQGIDTRNTTSDVHIRQNSTTALLDGNINGFGNQAPFNFTRYLAAGETLDFAVGFGSNGDYNGDSTGLAVTITENIFNIADGDVAGLIAAINRANASACPTTINLAPNGTYTLTAVAEHSEDYGASGPAGLPYIRSEITINGNGAAVQRSNAPGTPDFAILVDWKGNLTLDGVTLKGGFGPNTGGMGVTTATRLIRNSTFTQNVGGGGGGAITSLDSILTIVNSTISYNTNSSGYGGGGILHFGCCNTLSISFSTIFENRNDYWGRGDAIATGFTNPTQVFVKNSSLGSPTRGAGNVCWLSPGALVSQGHNIAGDASCALVFAGPGDMNNTNPLLGPLANNGGPTFTHLPSECSPAIDTVPVDDSTDVNGGPTTTDERGISRPQGGASDIGAVEVARSQTVT